MDFQHKPRNIVIGQKFNAEKAAAARQMRHEMTPAEKVLWQHLRRNALGGFHFRRQQVIAGYIVDFYCHHAALAVECDGAQHDAAYDAARDAALASLGISVLRFRNEEVIQRTSEVLRKILEVLRERCGST